MRKFVDPFSVPPDLRDWLGIAFSVLKKFPFWGREKSGSNVECNSVLQQLDLKPVHTDGLIKTCEKKGIVASFSRNSKLKTIVTTVTVEKDSSSVLAAIFTYSGKYRFPQVAKALKRRQRAQKVSGIQCRGRPVLVHC